MDDAGPSQRPSSSYYMPTPNFHSDAGPSQHASQHPFTPWESTSAGGFANYANPHHQFESTNTFTPRHSFDSFLTAMHTPSQSAGLQHDVATRDLEHDLNESLRQPGSQHIQMDTQRRQNRRDAGLRTVVRRPRNFDS